MSEHSKDSDLRLESTGIMTVQWVQECETCKGTGIHVDWTEGDSGVGIVCRDCKGTGRVEKSFTYREFTGLKERDDIRTVVSCNPGIDMRGGTQAGIPYNTWLEEPELVRSRFFEDRESVCPAWWYQVADSDNRPEWDECTLGSFPRCKHFSDKTKCWERFDKEQDELENPEGS